MEDLETQRLRSFWTPFFAVLPRFLIPAFPVLLVTLAGFYGAFYCSGFIRGLGWIAFIAGSVVELFMVLVFISGCRSMQRKTNAALDSSNDLTADQVLDQIRKNVVPPKSPVTVSPAKRISHEEAVQRLSGVKFFGGRGENIKDAIQIGPENFEQFQEKCREALGDTLPEESAQATEMVNGLIGEMIKLQYLAERFGKKDKDWFCGKRAYLESTIQSQEIKFADGQALTLFFNFSAIHGPFTRKEANENPPTIYVDQNALAYELRLVGRHTTVMIHAEMFGILLVTAHNNGWRGGSHLLKTKDGQVSLRDFDTAILDDEEARTFGETLSRSMQVDPETIEDEGMQPLFDLIELCKDGGFKIQIQTPTDN